MSTQQERLLDRFMKYAKIDTQSSEESTSFPSTEKQKDLARVIVEDLKKAGIKDAKMDEHGYVIASLPSNLSNEQAKKIPVIAFIAHMDTIPGGGGQNIKPQVVKNYQGGDIVLKGDPTKKITTTDSPTLSKCIGHDIITSDGTSILGADNKAGVAEIVELFARLTEEHSKHKHGTIKAVFTPDEEVGRGTERLDVKALGANFAYTVDGGEVGEIEDETFCADSAIVTITGINTHPGYAKAKGMVNAIRVISHLTSHLPMEMSPEQTEGREGFLHPYTLEAEAGHAKLTLIVRDFTVDGLKEKERTLEKIVQETRDKFPKAVIACEFKESYRNMKYKIDEDKRVVEYVIEAMNRIGITPIKRLVRGGTDGSQLSYKGLLTPNIFCGEQNFHMLTEWTSLQWMDKAVENMTSIACVWAEKSL